MLEHLEPKPVWKYFEQFCAIPHPSGCEQAAARFIIDVAAKLGLPAITDATGNILVRKKGTAGYTDKSPVVLQSHLDMVAQKNSTTKHDFTKDPIQPYIDGEWVRARNTTLGADNGIGVAIACAVLENNEISHPPIEALFTLDEERGMTGAFGMSPDLLTGKRLINLDTENEQELCIGCAGGTDIVALLSVTRTPPTPERTGAEISIRGLSGGHSGMEIHLGRGNALKLAARLLADLSSHIDLQIASLQGGSARNAIPREAFITVAIRPSDSEALKKAAMSMEKTLRSELGAADPGLSISIAETALPKQVLDMTSSKRLVAALAGCPYGVIRMSASMPGVVETSNNLSIVTPIPEGFRVECMLRSSLDSAMADLRKRVSTVFTDAQAAVTIGNSYPGWQPEPGSRLLAIMKQAYAAVHGREPEVVAVHAGLECGIIGAKYPGMELISCGPTIRLAHSPDEQMNIPSVERFWRCMVEGLRRL
jgi:dipeptidase D